MARHDEIRDEIAPSGVVKNGSVLRAVVWKVARLQGEVEWAHLGSNQAHPLATLVDRRPLVALFAGVSGARGTVARVGLPTLARSRGGRGVVRGA